MLHKVKKAKDFSDYQCTVGRFGDDNVWQKWMNKNFGKQVLQMNRLTKRFIIKSLYLEQF